VNGIKREKETRSKSQLKNFDLVVPLCVFFTENSATRLKSNTGGNNDSLAIFYYNYLNNFNFNNRSDKIKILRIKIAVCHCQWRLFFLTF
jgi:hypothetical protein